MQFINPNQKIKKTSADSQNGATEISWYPWRLDATDWREGVHICSCVLLSICVLEPDIASLPWLGCLSLMVSTNSVHSGGRAPTQNLEEAMDHHFLQI